MTRMPDSPPKPKAARNSAVSNGRRYQPVRLEPADEPNGEADRLDVSVGPLDLDVNRLHDHDQDSTDQELVSNEERARILAGDDDRDRLRGELEGYLASLQSRRDEDGEAVVSFPDNYDQVVDLMTEQDVRVEDEDEHQSWARVLLETGLAKQQAFVS